MKASNPIGLAILIVFLVFGFSLFVFFAWRATDAFEHRTDHNACYVPQATALCESKGLSYYYNYGFQGTVVCKSAVGELTEYKIDFQKCEAKP